MVINSCAFFHKAIHCHAAMFRYQPYPSHRNSGLVMFVPRVISGSASDVSNVSKVSKPPSDRPEPSIPFHHPPSIHDPSACGPNCIHSQKFRGKVDVLVGIIKECTEEIEKFPGVFCRDYNVPYIPVEYTDLDEYEETLERLTQECRRAEEDFDLLEPNGDKILCRIAYDWSVDECKADVGAETFAAGSRVLKAWSDFDVFINKKIPVDLTKLRLKVMELNTKMSNAKYQLRKLCMDNSWFSADIPNFVFSPPTGPYKPMP